MTTITDGGFARIDKTSIIRNPSNSAALTGNDISYSPSLTLNEKIDSITGGGGGGGGGDLSSNTSISVDNEVMLFSGTTGKLAKRGNTLNGLYKLVSGIFTPATNTDIPSMTATVGGAVPTPPNDASKFLNGQGAFTVPAGGGDMVLSSAQTVSGLKTFLDGIFGLRNVANTFTSFFTNTNTASRTYTLKDASGTLAFTSDITGTNSGTNTGDQTSIVGITGTMSQFDTAVSDGNIVYQSQALGTPTSGTLTNTTGYQEIKLSRILPSTATDAATVTFDLSANNKWQLVTNVAGATRTLALSNTTNIPVFSINIKQDATGSRTVTWFSGITWVGGVTPTLTTTANKTDSFGFQQISSGVYLGFTIGQNI